MHFLNPIFLWGMLGLSIPIAIHLLSRKEGKIIKLGSLRHLQETSTKQFKGIKLNELVLLTLRCLLIIIFCLLLSGLYLNLPGTKKWVVIEKGIANQIKDVLDSLSNQGYKLHWLSKNLPLFTPNDTSGLTSDVSYAQAIDQLDKFQVSEAIIFAKNNPNKFSGARLSLPSGIRWITVATDPQDYTLYSLQYKPDSMLVRTGHTNYRKTTYTNEKSRSVSDHVHSPGEINILLFADDQYQYDKMIMKAALDVIDETLYHQLNLDESKPVSQLKNDSSQWVIWLSDRSAPRTSSKLISLNVQPLSDLLIQTAPNRWDITKRLTEETALKENLTLRIADLITPDKNIMQNTAGVYDRRMIPDSIAWSSTPSTAAASSSLLQTSANPWLLVLLFLILMTERIIAYRRNQ